MNRFRPFGPGCLAGQVAVVTGAAGGIGSATAVRLAELGAVPVLVDLRPGRHPGLDLPILGCDLRREREVEALFAGVWADHGRLDVLVNAAGVLRVTPLLELSQAEWEEVIAANATTAFLCCREAARRLIAQGGGSIVNFSSVAAMLGGILSGPHYAASKAAVVSLTRSVAKLLAPTGGRCNVLAPAGVETEMLRQYSLEQREDLRRGIPAGRFGTVEEIAELVCWLASPSSDYVTGQTIHVNGGSYLG